MEIENDNDNANNILGVPSAIPINSENNNNNNSVDLQREQEKI